MDRPTCKTCPFYDATAMVEVYVNPWPGYAPMPPTKVPGMCRRYPQVSPHKEPEEWCGEHPLFPQWFSVTDLPVKESS